MKTLYALLIGVNNYPENPLAGCINDVLAINDHFQKLCDAQEEETIWNPIFILAPNASDIEKLQQRGIKYKRPTRQNIIEGFNHFNAAIAEQGDYCLLYYSGHGSYLTTDKMLLFEDYEPSGEMQSLVCLDEDEKSKTLHHLLDKELGYLIARTLEGKSVHFLSIMDCCHSGTNTRTGQSQIKARMHSGSGVLAPKVPLGFTRDGNCFYLPFKGDQKKVQPGGLTSARHISFAGSQPSESTYEMPLSLATQNGNNASIRHGLFTVSLIKTLEQSGTNISYRELCQRVQMEVRSRIDKQIPLLDSMMSKDADLYFLQNQFSPPKQEYLVAFRENPNQEWILNAGAIQGISPSTGSEITKVQLNGEDQRIVTVKEVRATESVLDASKFSEEDKANMLLHATIHDMAYPTVNIAFGEDLPNHMREQINIEWADRTPKYLNQVEANIPYQLEINRIENNDGSESFILTRLGSSVPLFERHDHASIFLGDADKVGRYDAVVQMSNPDSTISREDFKVEVKVLEGKPFTRHTLNDIPETDYRSVDPEQAEVYFKKVNGNYQQPAIKVRVTCTQPMMPNYWIGALYCDAQFGITDRYLQVQQIGILQSNFVDLEYTLKEHGQIIRWQSIPLLVSDGWHQLGVTEIQDHIIIFISDAHQPFSLEKYNQPGIVLDRMRNAGFLPENSPKKDSWRTIKIPIRISWPKNKVEIQAGQDPVKLSALKLATNSPTPFNVQITNTSSTKRRIKENLQSAKKIKNQQSFLPPGKLWNNVEGAEEIFSQCPSGAPDMQLNILELTPISKYETIKENTTLTITPRDFPSEDEVIVPFGFDEELGLYLPLGQTDKKGKIQIEKLPPESKVLIGADGIQLDEVERSLGGSIKLFFKKIVWSKLSGRHDYHQLSWHFKEDDKIQQVIYNTSKNTIEGNVKIKTKIADAKNVLLLVHGITGDTEEMIEWAFHRSEAAQQYDAILAFDYENLCSGISNIAKSLKQMLLDCGIQDKQLTIIAHSMGGLVTRWMIEKEDGAPLVKKLIQAGTPNGGTTLSELRKKMAAWLTLGMNGFPYIQPYMPIVTFLSQRIFNPLFITLNDMHPESKFITALNDANNQTDVPYHLIAGKTSHIEALYQEEDPMYKKLTACIKDRGHYFLADFFHNEKDNDFVVPVESMQAVPWGHVEVEVVECDHFGYFAKEIISV